MAPFIDFTFAVDGVPTDLLSVPVLSSPDETYGLRLSESGAMIVTDTTVFTRIGIGTYRYDIGPLDLAADVIYDAWIEYEYAAETTHVQRFIIGTGAAVDERSLRFLVINAGLPITLLTVPRLSSPTATYGVARTDTKKRVVADNTPYVIESGSGSLYIVSFGEPAPGLTYRYYVEVGYGGKTWYLPSMTRVVNSAMLVLGRYTDSYLVQQMFSADSLHKWMTNNSDEGDEPTDYAMRVYDFIAEAEGTIDEFVLGDYVSGPFTDPLPRAVIWAATALAGVLMYESSGIVDTNAVTGEPEHRYATHRRRAEQILRRLRAGAIQFDGILKQVHAPGIVEQDADCDTELSPWSV